MLLAAQCQNVWKTESVHSSVLCGYRRSKTWSIQYLGEKKTKKNEIDNLRRFIAVSLNKKSVIYQTIFFSSMVSDCYLKTMGLIQWKNKTMVLSQILNVSCFPFKTSFQENNFLEINLWMTDKAQKWQNWFLPCSSQNTQHRFLTSWATTMYLLFIVLRVWSCAWPPCFDRLTAVPG